MVMEKIMDNDEVDAIIAHVKGKGKEILVFHCQVSDKRGSHAAAR